jgi:hypothetical protein
MKFRDFIVQEALSKQQYNKLREKLSSSNHDQWINWAKYVMKNHSKKDFAQWSGEIKTPYPKLAKWEKDGDREWTDKELKIIKQYVKDL